MKICSSCKIEKLKSEFFKNKTKKDGLQNYCKQCGKDKWGKWFNCVSCRKEFYVAHRNVSQRKTRLCRECVKTSQAERIIAQNKASAREFVLTEKGYKYVRDLVEIHGYKFLHRKKMEESLGRTLTKKEVVHHIDGNKLNNEINNLFLTDRTEHANIHAGLERVAFLLVRSGEIVFNQETRQYELSIK